jgi:hypothetical protein
MAFGKRMRIANAITDLRRPPSIEYSEDHHSSPSQHQSNSTSQSHSRTQSQTATGVAAGMSAAAGVGLGIALSPMNAPSEVSSFLNLFTYIYLLLCFKKLPPSRLFLSSSNAALKESAVKTVAVNGDDEERGHMSDVRLKSPCPIVSGD